MAAPTPLTVAHLMYGILIDDELSEIERAAALPGLIAVSLLAIAEELHVMNERAEQ